MRLSRPFKNLHLVASGVNRIIILSRTAVRSDPAYAGCYFRNGPLADKEHDGEQEPGEEHRHRQGPGLQLGAQARGQRIEPRLAGGALTVAKQAAALQQRDEGVDAEPTQEGCEQIAEL